MLGSAAAALAAACGAASETTAATPEGGAEGGQVVVATCPAAQPTNGSPCLLPEGTTCDFGLCGTRLAQCLRGAWRLAPNEPPAPACPDPAPNPGVSCPPCWPAAVSCAYGSTNCSLADASDNTTVASCPAGGWVVEFRPCRDAGPDVQGDGGRDAD